MFSGTMKRWTVLVAVAALAAFVVACGTEDTPLTRNDGVGAQPTPEVPGSGDVPAPGDQGFQVVEVLAPIESVQILVLESFPEQYIVQVISGLPSGCATYSHNEVTRDGTNVTISVYNTVPAPGELIACTQIYGLHDQNVALGSDFERGVEYAVMVNDHPAEHFTTGVAGLPQIDDSPVFVIEAAPLVRLRIVIGEDSTGSTTYSADVVWGLTNGCKESLDPNIVQYSRFDFEIFPLVRAPIGDIACTDDYRYDTAELELGVVGTDLISCAVYTVSAGGQTIEFQAIAPNVRCADPDAATPTPAPTTGGGSIIADSQALELSLESKGAEVEFGGRSAFSEMFGLQPSELKVNGESVQIYEFAPGTSAEEASEAVSADGTTIVNPDGSAMSVFWVAPPHFYLFGNSIILYVGTDPSIGALLDSVASKFAGRDFEDLPGGSGAGDYIYSPSQIEQVTIASTRSIPAQFIVGVVVVLGNGCEEFGDVDWFVKGREVFINMTTRSPATPTICTLAIAYVDQSVNIGSDYAAGVEYDVIVNGERAGTFVGG